MDADHYLNKRVLIKPLHELGTVVSHHRDEREEPVIVVVRDSDGERHCCRMAELKLQFDFNDLLRNYEEVLAALETIVPVFQNVLLHHEKNMTPVDLVGRSAILKMCEETLERVSSQG
jgi:hypothetical protein